MAITVLFFGQAAELTGKRSEVLEDYNSSQSLRSALLERYPGLNYVSFTLAVNRRIIRSETVLHDEDTLAVLPPFSGG